MNMNMKNMLRKSFVTCKRMTYIAIWKRPPTSTKRIDYLGFIISEDGVEVNQEKVTAALKWIAPKSVKNVQEFLGFVNFYRCFIPNFGNLAHPLYDLLKKDQIWHWGEKEQDSFKVLKGCLTMAPILIQPNITKQFFLECDTSDYAMGAILSQKTIEGKLLPVCFLSKSFSPAEQNYQIFDKELLAIIHAFKKGPPCPFKFSQTTKTWNTSQNNEN
ncbi:hypothetical protein RSAG8_04146, partial [Rhizoctonia solani AG-8 WAC10335]